MQTQNKDALIAAIQNEGTIRMDKQRLYTEEEHQFVLDLLQGKKEEDIGDEEQCPMPVSQLNLIVTKIMEAIKASRTAEWNKIDEHMLADVEEEWFDYLEHEITAGCAHVRSQQSAKDKEKDELLKSMIVFVKDSHEDFPSDLTADIIKRYNSLTK